MVLLIGGGSLAAVPLWAQPGAMVQPTPPAQAVERLNENLTRLSRAPTDMEALLGAGQAAYDLGDAQAASGFFTRAELVDPRSGRAKIGLALVELALKQPVAAARHFDEAAALGVGAGDYLPEKALAYDLVGNQAQAQRDYLIALRANPRDEELIRHYAISLGVSGRLTEAEALLRPLLTQSNRAAWRDRTMILAMNGHVAEARRIAGSTMPPGMADAMDPYLIRMGALTPAQKAVAAHYGQFPPDGLKLAPVMSPPAAVQVAGKQDERKGRRKGRQEDAVAPVPPVVAGDDPALLAAMPRRESASGPPVALARASQPSSARGRGGAEDDPDGWSAAERKIAEQRIAARPQDGPSALAAARARAQDRAAQASAGTPPATSGAARPWGVVASAAAANVEPKMVPASPPPASSAPAAPRSEPVGPTLPVPSPIPPSGRTLADIMADITVPETERQGGVTPVDLTAVARLQAQQAKAEAADRAKKEAAAKAKAAAEAKAKAEAEEKARIKANPSRSWVQVATGKDAGALAFDLRRLKRTYSGLADQNGYTAEWGQTRRLLVGPFATIAKAKALEADVRKAGGDAFVWQSDAGEVVTPLGKK